METIENKTQGNVEKMVNTHILEVDPHTGFDLRYIPVRVSKEDAKYYPRIVYHDMMDK